MAPTPRAEGPTRIGWRSARTGAVSGAVRAQLLAAAATLSGEVEIVQLGAAAVPLDAIVTLGPLTNADGASLALPEWSVSPVRPPLVVALAPDGATGEHLRLLGHDANVVLPATTHGRVVLATVLALLRWRGG